MNRFQKIMTRVAATDKTFAEKQIEEVIGSLSYLPVDYHFEGAQAREVKALMEGAVKNLEKVLAMFPTPVVYNVYGIGDKTLSFDNEADLIAEMRRRGVRHTGIEMGRQLRQELQGRPTFDKLLGPMYDGPKQVRYETQAVYDVLSR
jgi:hypothetical protein